MTDNIGVWIDHRKAVIVVPGHGETTIESRLDAHTRHKGGGGYPGSPSSQTGGSEKRFEARARGERQRYLDTVIAAIGHPKRLFVLGPGEAKAALLARLRRLPPMPKPTVATATADKLTRRQLVRQVLAHFGERPVRLMPRR